MSEVRSVSGWTRERAARFIAFESWPNERLENRESWQGRLLTEPDMVQREVKHALERIERRRQMVLKAAETLGHTPAPVVARPAPQTEGERDHETD